MPISVYVDAAIGATTAGAGIRIDLGSISSSIQKPLDFSFPLGKIDSPNEAEIIAINRAADLFNNLVHLIDARCKLRDEYVIVKCDSAAAIKAIELNEQIKPQPLRVLVKKTRRAWDSVRVDRPDGAGLIAGWSIEKITRKNNPAHSLANAAIRQLEGLYKWTPNATNSGTSSSKGSRSARRPRQ